MVYEHRLFTIPYDTTAHWIIAAFGADFCYYWAHRLVHELSIGWSSHQVHHSSEDYNLSTALRQSIMQTWYTTIPCLGAALFGVHPSMFYTHYRFVTYSILTYCFHLFQLYLSINLTWQFWIHTESIRHMGWFMEFFFNTPSHHRVHHGRNPFCIDKNYAGLGYPLCDFELNPNQGVLIIWDRMFGTFQSEFATEEKVQYGLVQNIRSFDPTYIQFGYLQYVLTKAYHTRGIKNKLNVLLMGPGYNPEQPEYRLGDPKKLPEIDSKYKIFNPEISNAMKIYAFIAGVHANLLFEAAQVN